MRIITMCDGIEIYCLPDSALCCAARQNPEKMLTCPLQKFDPYGEICHPDYCEEYYE